MIRHLLILRKALFSTGGKSIVLWAAAVASCAPFCQAATIEKANNTVNLEDGGSWVGGTGGGSIGVPTSSDIALWDNIITGANSSTQAADLSWLGIQVTNPGGAITIANGAVAISTTASTATSTLTGTIANGELVTVGGTTAPTGLALATSYYVVNSDTVGGTFQVATTPGGTPITLTAAGTAVTYTQQFLTTLGASGIDMSAATQNLSINSAISIGSAQTWSIATGRSLTMSGVVAGASANISKNGGGSLTLNRIERFSNPTITVNNGTLVLDGSAFTATGQAVLPGGTTLNMSGGTMNSKIGGLNAVQWTIPTLNINVGGSAFTQSRGSGGRIVNIFTNVNRSVGGTLDITDAGNSSSYRMNTAKNVNGIVPNVVYSGTDWYVANGTSADGSRFAAYTATTATSVGTSAQNVNVVTDVAVPSGGAQINTLRFNDSANSRTITVGNGDTLTVGTGDILVTNNVASHHSRITGGTLLGAPGADLVIIQNDTPVAGNAELKIDSLIADNGAPTGLTKSGVGLLVLTNIANTYSGNNYLNGGTLQITAESPSFGSLGTVPASPVANNITFTGGTLQLASSFNINSNRGITLNDKGGTLDTNGGNSTYGGIIAGVGPFTKAGAGTLRLTGTNTSTGNTVVSAGTLLANNSSGSATGAGTISVSSGATFGGTGTAAGTLVPASGAHIAPGDGSVSTLTIGGLTANSGSIFDFEFANDTTYDKLVMTNANAFTLNGGGINVLAAGTNLKYTPTGDHIYNLFQYNGSLSGLPDNFSVLNPQAGLTYSFANSGGFVTLEIAGTPTLTSTWNTDVDNQNWSAVGNWTAGVPHNAGDSANFLSVITGARTIRLDSSQTVGSMTFDNPNSYTIAAVSASTLTIDNAGFAGAINDANGSHTIAAPVTLNSNTTITVTNASDVFTLAGNINGSGTLTTSGAGTVVLTGTNTYLGNTTIGASSTLQLGSATVPTGGTLGGTNITDNGKLVFNRSDALSFNGVISGSGAVQFNGAGTVTLGGANSYAGATTINAGTVNLGNAAALSGGNVTMNGGTLDVKGFSPTFTNLTGAAGTVLDNSTASAATVTINNSGAVTFSGVVQNSGGALGIIKNGAGTLTLAGVNTYTGGTTINAGVLKVNDGTGLGDVGGAVTINAATLEYAGTATTARSVIPANAASTIQVDTGFTVTNTNPSGITGTGLAKTGAGTYVVSGPLTLTNSPTITGGTLAIASPTNSFTLTSPLVGGTFQIDAGGVYSLPAFTFGNATTAGNLRVNGGTFTATGTISLVGISNSGGGAAITIEAGSNATFGNINFGTADGANLNIKGGNVSIGAINIPRSGAGGGGATPDFSHGIIVSGGTTTIASLSLGTSNSWGTLSVSGGNVTISGPITMASQATSGRGAAIQVSGGTLTSTDPNGLQMALVNATNQNNKATATFTGGTSTFERIVMITDDAITSSSATVSVGGTGSTGALYIGSGGIQTHLAGGSTATVNLSGGIFGANASFSASAPFVLSDTNGGATVQAADAANVPHDITITGSITGSTLTKTGGGTLSLFPTTNTNNNTGINLTAGNLVASSDGLAGSIVTAAANQTVTINQPQGTSLGGTYTYASISGPASLVKTGAGTATLGANHSYTGNTTVGQGTLVLAANDSIASTSKVILSGGKLGTNAGLSQNFTTAPLGVTASSAIDMGLGSGSVFHFADSGAAANPWSGTLTVANWDGTPGVVSNGSSDQLLFTSSGTGGLSAAQKAAIHFAGYNGAVALSSTLFPGSIEVVPGSLSTLHIGDWNINGSIDLGDIPAMLSALTDLNAYKSAGSPLHSAHPQALSVDDLLNIGDVDLSGSINNSDIQAELDLASSMGLGSVAAVPEPATWVLLGLGGALVLARRRSRAKAC